jgi:Rieske Fe-S protein
MDESGSACPGRRCVLASMAVAGAAALGGCAVYGDETGAAAAPVDAAPTPETAATSEAAATSGAATKAAAADALAELADVPVGGGLVLAGQKLVLTQPKAGTVKAFSITCTHAGCAVSEVKDGTINCPCHGSKFAIADGSPTAGPAPRPLAAIAVSVQDGAVVRG